MSVVLQNNTANRISVGRFVVNPQEALTISKTDFLHYDPFVPNSLAEDLKRMVELNFLTVSYNGLEVGADTALKMASSDTDVEVFDIHLSGSAGADDASALVVADGDYEVVAARAGVNSSGGIAESDTNFISVIITNETTGGVVGSESTETVASGGSGTLSQWDVMSIPLDADEVEVSSGDVLSASVASTGTGVAYDLSIELVMVRTA